MSQTLPLSLHREAIAPGLYVVATPIGNLADITLRALTVLMSADLIACEDTRVTGKLLHRFGITAQTLPYHDHNAAHARPKLLAALKEGKRVALVSDAGTPLISDPGYKLVREVVEHGFPVTAIPGPSSVMAALCIAGLPTDRFFFAGFLPSAQSQRRREIERLSTIPATLIFFESAGRVAEGLQDLAELLGPRDAALTRELTKLYEEARRGTLAELAEHYASAPQPKGEIVLVIGPPPEKIRTSEEDIDAALRDALARLSLRDAANEVAASLELPANDTYRRALKLMKEIRDE